MRAITFILAAAAFAALSCEAVVGDFEARPCDPDPPASCADLGDAEAQAVGCCDGAAAHVWFCEGGQLASVPCGTGTCDYDPARGLMACVE
jgi:hypothetical protein